ncbi:hypothetical protein QYF61_015878 [Mycteria americana]|uniref:Rna-directed dna polymerase from mobile element jockey-like n=1 Tax=Mycteria americana TaxID=33587 RepID=A0AAN7S148_MYCAM|nr:hypothetical protein QYF61_015878 [Mycteria americana]
MELLLNGAGELVINDMKKAEVLNVFFASDLTSKINLRESHAHETRGKVWNEDLPSVKEDQTRDHLNRLDMYLQEGNLGNCRLVSHISVPGKVMEKIFLEVISKHVKDKNVIGSCQHGFTKTKSCWSNHVAFYSEMTCLVDKGKAERADRPAGFIPQGEWKMEETSRLLSGSPRAALIVQRLSDEPDELAVQQGSHELELPQEVLGLARGRGAFPLPGVP